ncbi:DnaB-like helicase N-terminal domain-containing protein [Streptomyces sp. SP17BM10]|uniref:DnaB-like helicase N-terminal domain-containing protein n=1 Tax=Streptomyces sp. SP17BM10 TaxID=3002530 RepID=UPI002E7956F2|nr:DnaB-like helicase N-terminal domain-containing protein [Streptomyces sp. SP17BM10]MEE1786910.1 DnaB-like helicase N-terminal domain-containing protein [Streptomyces sp. SP17BM10]
MDALFKGEQALLGAVLLDPDQLDALSWLKPADFYRPVHQALFAAMRTVSSQERPIRAADGTVPLTWLTSTVAEAGRHVRGLSASYAHTLIAACPRPQNAPVYGRMVLEGAIHRTVTKHAVRLEQVARIDAEQQQVEGVLHHADVLAGVLGDLARRWGTEPRPVAPPDAGTSAKPPRPVGPEEAEDERFLLAVLVSQPAAMAEVYDWLRPGDFADPGHGQVYRCLGALHHRGEPIDQVTALWEVQRRGLLADGTLSREQLDSLFGGPGAGSAEWLGDQVIRSSVVRTAAGAATTIKALAEDEALVPGRLIGQALHALGPLDEVRARWRTATGRPSTSSEVDDPAERSDPSARVHAALSRSAARQSAPQAVTPTVPLVRSRTATTPRSRTSPSRHLRSSP